MHDTTLMEVAMATPLRVLIIEDSEDDALLIIRALRHGGYEPSSERVETQEAMAAALEHKPWHLVISDYKMPRFNGIAALNLYKEKGFDIPFIIVSGTIGEETAVEAMKAGAHDYVMKNNLSRLVPAIQRELREAETRVKQRQAEEALKESEEQYRLVVENAAEAILIAQDGVMKFVNRGTMELTGHSEEILTSTPFTEFIHPEDREMVLHRHVQRIQGEVFPAVYPFRVVTRDETIKWVEIRTTPVVWKGKPATLNFLTDITSRKQAEEELKQTLEKLRKSLLGTIQAMSLTVETRDPYTAGHQRRVSTLARTIAQEMNISNDMIDTISMAASIHDIGKMSIPAEILSKPGILTAIERRLIEVHPQTGYDVLKDVELPSPIAEIVLQHHERLDGSGYPQALKDGQILLEAQIIAVADVVEAISTHRPYRPAFGIDMALDEIEKNRGILYNAEVVGVCLKLFREKGFGFE